MWVPGDPAPQGSLSSFKSHSTGKIVTPQKPSVRTWRDRIAAYVAAERIGQELVHEAVCTYIKFFVKRPKSHYGTGSNSGQVRRSAPKVPSGRPDLDKLERALNDALTGILWQDDAQVVTCQKHKRYGNPGVEFRVWLYDPSEDE